MRRGGIGDQGEVGVEATGILLAVVAALALVLAGWSRWIQLRPLALAPRAVRGDLWGRPVVRLRARLGHGRRVARVEVRAHLAFADGTEVPLAVDDPEVPRVGAWTLTLLDPQDLASGPADLFVEVVAHDGRRAWPASARYALADRPRGRFAPLVEVEAGRWRAGARPFEVSEAVGEDR